MENDYPTPLPSSIQEKTALPESEQPSVGATAAEEDLDPISKKTICGVVVCLGALIAYIFLFNWYTIPSQSMYPTLDGKPNKQGDYVLSANWMKPSTNDIVIFPAPKTWKSVPQGEILIKRVIAKGGSTISCCTAQGDYIVDNHIVKPPYPKEDYPFIAKENDCATSPRSQRCFPEQKIPQGYLWVMGDNRGVSADSSYGCRDGQGAVCQGPIPAKSVKAVALLVGFPFKHWKLL